MTEWGYIEDGLFSSTLLSTSLDNTQRTKSAGIVGKRLLDLLHQDNASAHNALSVKRFLAKNRTPVLQHLIRQISLRVTFGCFQN